MGNDRSENNTESLIDLDKNVNFVTLNAQEIITKVKKITITMENGTPRCGIRFEIDWLTYLRVLKSDWFGLFPEVRGGGSEAMFTENTPIEINALLRQSFAEALIERGDEAEDVLAYLLQESTIIDMPVKSSESWLATEVKQQVELPEKLIESGTLKKGYRTLWSGQIAAGQGSSIKVVSLNETIERYLDTVEWEYERIDDELLRLSIRGEQGTWVTLVRTDEDNHLCIVYSIYPQTVPENKRSTLSAFLIQENYDLPTGNFEMDLADGELRFRTGINVGQGQLTSELFAQLITSNVAVMDHYYTMIGEEIG